MRILSRSVALLIVLCLMLAGCGGRSAEERVKSENSEPAPSLQQAAFLVTVLQGPLGKTAVAEKKLPKDVVILKGSPLGAVKFEHKLHSQARSTKCETCHHASRSEKPAGALQQAC